MPAGEHPWRRNGAGIEQQQAEALWVIAAELREMNRQQADE